MASRNKKPGPDQIPLDFDITPVREVSDELGQSGVRADQTERLPVRDEFESTEKPVALDLGHYAVALEDVLTFLNQDARTKGGAIQEANPDSDFNRRYTFRASNVEGEMEHSRNHLRPGYNKGLETLAATDILRENGATKQEIEDERQLIQMEIHKEFHTDLVSKRGLAASRRRAAIKGAQGIRANLRAYPEQPDERFKQKVFPIKRLRK